MQKFQAFLRAECSDNMTATPQEAMKGAREARRTHYKQEVDENQEIWDSFTQIVHVASVVKHKKKARRFGGMSK